MFHSDVLCPYCLTELHGKDLDPVCNMCGNPGVISKKDLLFHRIPRCNTCPGSINARVCKSCKTKLPPDILEYEKYLRFSLLGTTGSGKSNFLTTMLHELLHASDTPWSLAAMENNTKAMYNENCDFVYKMGQPVPATPPGMTPPPHLWVLKDKLRMTKTRIPSYSITIFDGAGEDVENINPVISRYINGSKALVILIDPLALPGVAKTIDKNILNWSSTATHSDSASAQMVDGLAAYIRASCGIKPGTLINRDVAVVFTKLDAVESSFGSATVTQPSPHLARKGFVKADADAVDAEIRDWLESRGESIFLDSVETNFRKDKIRYFGVSSFGQPPTGASRLGKVVPHRVLDPLIWMLAKEGIAPTI